MTLPDIVPRALVTVLNELLDGASWDAGWVLNPGDPGILRSLDLLPAEAASAAPADGGSSIAAHVDHLRYGLELLNRWAGGEEPFTEANYGASWRRAVVDDEEWAARRQALRREACAWREAIERRVDANQEDLTTIVASVVHLAYHLGAIRQIDRLTAGPPAAD
ncbi:MAG TPA: DinB family protein [Vicinamibacterales bacterium]|nr:DinB family protein [Vicinamibacterales bacterium]